MVYILTNDDLKIYNMILDGNNVTTTSLLEILSNQNLKIFGIKLIKNRAWQSRYYLFYF